MDHLTKADDRWRTAGGGKTLLWGAFLLAGVSGLSLLFLFVLFFSPTGRQKPVIVDFNRYSAAASSETLETGVPELRIGFASQLDPRDAFEMYEKLAEYLCGKIGRRPRILYRSTFKEIEDLVESDKIDLAFMSTCPCLPGKGTWRSRVLAVPIIRGTPYHRAYIIVSRQATHVGMKDLRGKVFAMMSPESLTGTVYPHALLQKMEETPERFFGPIYFTHSQSDSILAVQQGIAVGASVDSLVFDYLQESNPARTSECRILEVSEPLGMPPVVSGAMVSDDMREGIRAVLLGMRADPAGKRILDEMRIDAFVPADAAQGFCEEIGMWLSVTSLPTGEGALRFVEP